MLYSPLPLEAVRNNACTYCDTPVEHEAVISVFFIFYLYTQKTTQADTRSCISLTLSNKGHLLVLNVLCFYGFFPLA